MSGPTWLPPRTLDSPERAGPQMSHSAGSAAYRASSKMMGGMSDFRPQYGSYDPSLQLTCSLASQHRGPDKPASPYHSKIDADIDSLTSMLADLDSHTQESSTQPQSQYHPVPPYSSESTQYSSSHQQDYYSPSSSVPKPYPQPVPASYTTASTPTGPRFSVQVKTAQPVTYSQTGRQAEQAYTPPPPRQHVPRPPHQSQANVQGWYPPHQAPEMHAEAGYKGLPGSAGRVSQVPLSNKPEEELERLTKKLVYDMNHPPSEDYFGRCARCGDNVVGDGSGCIAMEQVFHVECFTCITCHAHLRGQPFYALDKKSYCESCYISTLERCSKCSKPILDRILRAMGKAYHPRCFTCVVCNCCLDGVPFTVDATSQIHCIEDFHRKYAPRCSVCGEPIMPEQGQEETVRIVALDRSFHVNCYVCEECGLLLSSEGEGRGCYPLDGHILCKSCSARRIQDLSAKISTDC
uniref:LIM zinc-binding domain-containing protein n=1 Tax=Tetraodon nigroviridis TaxID=99883 RepID=H3CA38_TETNG